jgi:hypothetical protein
MTWVVKYQIKNVKYKIKSEVMIDSLSEADITSCLISQLDRNILVLSNKEVRHCLHKGLSLDHILVNLNPDPIF